MPMIRLGIGLKKCLWETLSLGPTSLLPVRHSTPLIRLLPFLISFPVINNFFFSSQFGLTTFKLGVASGMSGLG